MSARHRLIGLTVALLWGLNFIAIHAGLEHFPPFFFAALRFAVMAVPVIAFVPFPDVPLRWLLLYGVGFGTVQFAFLFLALAKGMPTGLASLVLQSSAPFTVVLGVVLLGERLSRPQIGGIAVAIGGMAVIAIDHGGAGMVPMVLTLIAGLGWAFGNLGSRLARSDDPMRLTLWMCVIPPIPLYLMSLVIEGPSAGLDSVATAFTPNGLIALGGLAYVVLLGTVAGSGLWSYLLSKHPVSTVAPFSLLVPVVGITASWIVLHERPRVLQLVGALIVIVGCQAGLMGSTRKPAPVKDSQACPTLPEHRGYASRFARGRRSRQRPALVGPRREQVAAKGP